MSSGSNTDFSSQKATASGLESQSHSKLQPTPQQEEQAEDVLGMSLQGPEIIMKQLRPQFYPGRLLLMAKQATNISKRVSSQVHGCVAIVQSRVKNCACSLKEPAH